MNHQPDVGGRFKNRSYLSENACIAENFMRVRETESELAPIFVITKSACYGYVITCDGIKPISKNVRCLKCSKLCLTLN